MPPLYDSVSDPKTTAMDLDERDAFLGSGGTGVISLSSANGESPHSVPVSYGYDSSEPTFYFRLAVSADSEKGDLTNRHATFVVYGQPEDEWRSVVAKGRLEETTEPSIATESLRGLEQVHIPLVDIFGRPTADVPFEFYRLVPAEITARKESSTAP